MRTRRAPALAALAALVLAACGAGRIEPLPVGQPPSSLAALPECDPPERPAIPVTVVDGADPLPTGAYLTASQDMGGLVVASGWADGTAESLRRFYEDDPPDAWEPITLENELVEAEVLLARGDTRFFVQAVAVCPDGLELYVRTIEHPG